MKGFELGLIEGFYGEPWSWETRADYARFLADAGYSFYFYAPKADPFFRRKWREPLPASLEGNLDRLIEAYHSAGVEFGVGFSPYEIHLSFDSEAKASLESRLETFNRLKVDRLAILFDDMKGAPDLAQTQADILHWVRDRSNAGNLVMCPTYYSLDPTLDRIFGPRAPDYLRQLGQRLDPSISVFWTGEEICSKGYTVEHISRINEELGRKVFLWDNYPVNDGPKMCKFLHIGAFENRPSELSRSLTAHAVNPMNQPWLSRIPLLTLMDSYRNGPLHSPQQRFAAACQQIAGPELGRLLQDDLELFSGKGLDQLNDTLRAGKIQAYSAFSHPLAREVIHWLEGRSVVTREVFLTQ